VRCLFLHTSHQGRLTCFKGLSAPEAKYSWNKGQCSLSWPYDLHITHHISSCLSFPLSFFISLTSRDKLVSWLKIWLIPEMDSPIGVDSSFIVISNASVCEAIFCCIRGNLMCGKREAMNHSLFCSSGI
jgi:hypothetical protein